MIKDRYIDGVVTRRIDQVRVGDRLDLQGDEYADPDNDPHTVFAYMFAEVESIEYEPHDTDPCIALHTSLGSFSFPPDHWVVVDVEQVRDE
jgi:hypothetical protein